MIAPPNATMNKSNTIRVMPPNDQKLPAPSKLRKREDGSHTAGDGKPECDDFGLWTLDSRLWSWLWLQRCVGQRGLELEARPCCQTLLNCCQILLILLTWKQLVSL